MALWWRPSPISTTRCGAFTSPARKPAEKRYALRGEVVSVDTTKKILVVKHEAIEGYMAVLREDGLPVPEDHFDAEVVAV